MKSRLFVLLLFPLLLWSALVVADDPAFYPPEHPSHTIELNHQARRYVVQGRYAEAEPLYQRALALMEKAFGPEHRYVALALNNLAYVHRLQGDYDIAEPLYQRALAIWEKELGSEHPPMNLDLPPFGILYEYTARAHNNLAELYEAQGRYAEAEPLYQRALALIEKEFGPEHPQVATRLCKLAVFYRSQGRYAEAEPLYRRSLAIRGEGACARAP